MTKRKVCTGGKAKTEVFYRNGFTRKILSDESGKEDRLFRLDFVFFT